MDDLMEDLSEHEDTTQDVISIDSIKKPKEVKKRKKRVLFGSIFLLLGMERL